MPEEKRCDICQHEKDFPCASKNCNIMNEYPCFEPKGEEKQDTGCTNCSHWAAVLIGDFCPDCGQRL